MAEPEDATQQLRLPSLLSEGLLLAWVPIAAYFITFSFEKGYCDEFAVPLYLVDVDMGAMFTCSLYLLFFFFVVGKMATYHLLPLKGGTITQGVGSYALIFGVIFIHSFIVGDTSWSQVWIQAALVIVPLFVVDVLYGRTIRAKVPSFRERIQGLRLLMPDTSKLSERAASLIEQAYRLAIVTFIVWYLSTGVGVYAATKQTDFLVLKSDPSLLLINVKEDKAICSRYDPKALKILHQLVIVPLKDDEQTEFQRTKITNLSFEN